jgi:hypothetical protein
MRFLSAAKRESDILDAYGSVEFLVEFYMRVSREGPRETHAVSLIESSITGDSSTAVAVVTEGNLTLPISIELREHRGDRAARR